MSRSFPLPVVSAPRTTLCWIGLLLGSTISQGAWPQWRGANRDGHAPDTGLLQLWTGEGPKLLWTAKGLV